MRYALKGQYNVSIGHRPMYAVSFRKCPFTLLRYFVVNAIRLMCCGKRITSAGRKGPTLTLLRPFRAYRILLKSNLSSNLVLDTHYLILTNHNWLRNSTSNSRIFNSVSRTRWLSTEFSGFSLSFFLAPSRVKPLSFTKL